MPNGVPERQVCAHSETPKKDPLAYGSLGKGPFWAFRNTKKSPLPNGPLAKGSFLGVPERAHTGRSGTPFGKAFLNGV